MHRNAAGENCSCSKLFPVSSFELITTVLPLLVLYTSFQQERSCTDGRHVDCCMLQYFDCGCAKALGGSQQDASALSATDVNFILHNAVIAALAVLKPRQNSISGGKSCLQAAREHESHRARNAKTCDCDTEAHKPIIQPRAGYRQFDLACQRVIRHTLTLGLLLPLFCQTAAPAHRCLSIFHHQDGGCKQRSN